MPKAQFICAILVAAVPQSLLQAYINPETGSPVFQFYSPDQYGAGPQNWAIAQDRRGVMYFGNTDGVLEFDGQSWRLIRLKNGSIVKSVAVDQQGKVFVGGQGDFGFLSPDQTGTEQFVSLLDKVPVEDRKILDVWRILPTPAGVYFSAYARLFRLNPDGSIRVWRPASNFGRAFYVLNSVYVKTPEQGLLRIEGDKLSTIAGGAMFANIPVPDAVSLDESALIATPTRLFRLDRAGGVQPFPTRADAWFASNLLYTIRLLPNGEIAAGSRQGGLALLNRDGALDRVLSKSTGLADDHIESIFADAQGGVWLAGYNGLMRFNPVFSSFGANLGPEGDTQCMIRHLGSIFVGTAAGLFRMESSVGRPPRFERIAGIETAVRTLQVRGNDLLAATDIGVFQVSGRQATQIFVTRPAIVWDVSLSLRNTDTAYAAGQAGVFMLRREGNSWVKAGEFTPSAQEFWTVLEDSDGSVWATTRDAIFRIDFREQPVLGEKFDAALGVPVVPGGYLNARRLQGHVTFATLKGLRRFSEDMKRFIPDLSLGREFADGSRTVFNIFDEPGGSVWVTGEKYHGVLLRQANGYKWDPMPLGGAGIKAIFWMSVDDDGTVWVTVDKGVLYRWERALAGNPDKNFNVLTRLIQINQKETLYGGAGAFEARSLPWRDNNLHFEFAAPFYEDPAAVEYQTQLEGSDREWSPWSHQTSRDYTHLENRGYQFRVRARTPHGTLNEQSAISFGILPPWYRTWWAYGIYLMSGAQGIWGILLLRTRQLRQARQRLETIVEERTSELEIKRLEAEQANRAKTEFLARMSHEIRTPLNAVIGMADVLRSSALTVDQERYVEVSQRNGIGLLNLINDILDLSKIEAGKIEIEETPFNLREVIAGAMEVIEIVAAKKGLWLLRTIAPEVPVFLIGDSNRLRQVLINLLGNSIKFTERGGLEVRVDREPGESVAGRFRFMVADTGIGIPPDKVTAVFESFTQADTSTTRKYGGTGLGLAIAKQIVGLMDGRIWLESTVGAGSSFFFTARFRIQEDQTNRPEHKPHALAYDLERQVNGMRILLADDSEDNRFLILSYLKNTGCTTDTAEDGAVALELFGKNRYDVVLMDAEMPVMDGYMATREIRRSERDGVRGENPTPVLALTAHAFVDMIAKGFEAGFTDVLTKPIRKVTLLEALAKHGKRAAEDSVPLNQQTMGVSPAYPPVTERNAAGQIRVVVEEEMRDIVLRYLAKRRAEIAVYREALAARNFESIRTMAHKMKGTGGGYGFAALTKIGGVIEQWANREDAGEILARLDELTYYLDNLKLEFE